MPVVRPTGTGEVEDEEEVMVIYFVVGDIVSCETDCKANVWKTILLVFCKVA